MGFAFTPAGRLELDSIYQAGFKPGLQPELQIGSEQGEISWRYQTVPAPEIVATEPTYGARDVARGGFELCSSRPR